MCPFFVLKFERLKSCMPLRKMKERGGFMLSGQEISVAESFVIAITGMAIVMLELAILALFVVILSKVLAPLAKAQAEKAAAAAPQPVAETGGCGLDDDEIAAVMTAICRESGRRPEEIVIKSIVVRN